MISLDDECAWTRRQRIEVFKRGGLLAGAGVQRSVFEYAAAAMGTGMTVAPDPEDEYGVKLTVGDDEIVLHMCYASTDGRGSFPGIHRCSTVHVISNGKRSPT